MHRITLNMHKMVLLQMVPHSKERKGFIGKINCLTIMCLCFNNDDFVHRCYFLLNNCTHYFDSSAIISTISEV